MNPESNGAGRSRLNLPPEWKDPPPLTEEEMRDIDANGISMDEIVRTIEAEYGHVEE
jgi:hypothetical protein